MVEQKPADDKAFEEWINDWWKHNKVNNPDSYDKGDEIQFDEKGFKNFCREIRNMYQQKPAEKQDYSGLTDLERAIHRGFLSAGVENVPVTIIKETANECKRTQTIADENANAEWSEEDERMVRFYEADYNNQIGDMSMKYVIDMRLQFKNWLVNRLKSLRPVSKESLQSHWNPSKEQMDALKDVAYGTYQNGNGPALRSLYEQLKKLGVKEEPEYYQHFDPDC
jgi:hypothetical protein